jgi:dimethylaniline monooxygenase (N-oxide forming)
LQYLNFAVSHYGIKIKLEHEVISMEEREDGWLICVRGPIDTSLRFFDYVIVATGLFTEGKYRPQYPGEDEFEGEITTERAIESMSQFVDKKVAVIGYGKAALDMATHSSFYSSQTYHIFRSPRWTIPDRIFTIDFSYILFSRLGTFMITCWTQPFYLARLIQSFATLVTIFWTVVGWVLRLQYQLYGFFQSSEIQKRIALTLTSEPLLHDKKFVVAILPSQYYPHIVEEKIIPVQDRFIGFSKTGVKLASGQHIPCDLVVLALGNQTPSFSFLPEKQRWLMEREGGVQLYRHVLHPKINRMGFIGFNHCYLHMNAVEIGTLWLIAAWRGDLILPSVEVPLPSPLASPRPHRHHLSIGNGSIDETSFEMERGAHRFRTNSRLSHLDQIPAIPGHTAPGPRPQSLPQDAEPLR